MSEATEIRDRLREILPQIVEQEKQITTGKYLMTRHGAALRVDTVLPRATPAETVAFDDTLIERFWDLNSMFPENAFALQIKAVERDEGLLFLEIETSGRGVYLKGKSFLEAQALLGFDRLAIQLPDAPVLCFAGTKLVGMIMTGIQVGNFVERREALRHGQWDTLDAAGGSSSAAAN